MKRLITGGWVYQNPDYDLYGKPGEKKNHQKKIDSFVLKGRFFFNNWFKIEVREMMQKIPNKILWLL